MRPDDQDLALLWDMLQAARKIEHFGLIRFLRISLCHGGSAPRPPAFFALGQWHEPGGSRLVKRPAARVCVRRASSCVGHGQGHPAPPAPPITMLLAQSEKCQGAGDSVPGRGALRNHRSTQKPDEPQIVAGGHPANPGTDRHAHAALAARCRLSERPFHSRGFRRYRSVKSTILPSSSTYRGVPVSSPICKARLAARRRAASIPARSGSSEFVARFGRLLVSCLPRRCAQNTLQALAESVSIRVNPCPDQSA